MSESPKPQFTACEEIDKSDDDIFTAGINYAEWQHKIECHGTTEAKAVELRDLVLRGLRLAEKFPPVTLYVTYGIGSNLANRYSKVEADTLSDAQAEINRVTCGHYAFSYGPAEFEGQVESYGLTEVPLQPHVIPGVHDV